MTSTDDVPGAVGGTLLSVDMHLFDKPVKKEEEEDEYSTKSIEAPHVKTSLKCEDPDEPLTNMKIGTWNVRTMGGKDPEKNKLGTVISEMKRVGLSILGLCETRWDDVKNDWIDGVKVFASGGSGGQRGVALLLAEHLGKRETRVDYLGERLLKVEISAKPTNIVIFQAYFPTTEADEDEIEDFYEILEEELDYVKGTHYLVLMGDFNASVGEGRDGNEVGGHGAGKRNERGQKLVEFCRRKKLVITNTWYKHRKSHVNTWRHPKKGFYQLDYILVRQRYRNSVLDSRSHPRTQFDSDHCLVAMDARIRFKRIVGGRREKCWNLTGLKNERLIKYRKEVSRKLRADDGEYDNDRKWTRLKEAMVFGAERCFGKVERKRIRKPWITHDMLDKMEERRRWKFDGTEEGKRKYRELNNKLRRATDKARDAWLVKQSDHIHHYQLQSRSDLAYEKAKETSTRHKAIRKHCVKDRNGNLLTKPAEVRGRWKDYTEELCGREQRPLGITVERERHVQDDDVGPSLLDSELDEAFKKLKTRKSTAPGDVPAELIRALGEDGKRDLKKLCRRIYEQGEWPEDFKKSAMVPIRMQKDSVRCEDHRMISLVPHASKMILKILKSRIKAKANEYIGRDQFGYSKGLGKREAIAVLRTLAEKSVEIDKELLVCFVHIDNAIERVLWPKMIKVLKKIGVHWRDRRLITKLYMDQSVSITDAVGVSEMVTVGRGLRAGCPLSPVLFSLYSEAMMRKKTVEENANEDSGDCEEREEGVKVGGMRVQSVRYREHVALVSNTEEGLQRLLDDLSEKATKFGLAISEERSKVMKFARYYTGKIKRLEPSKVRVGLNGRHLEQVSRLEYLGCILSQDCTCTDEIKARVVLGKEAYERWKMFFSKKRDREFKEKMAKTLVWSVVLYAAETWTIRTEDERCLESFEKWLGKRMEGLTRLEKRSEGGGTRVLRTILEMQKNWIGHVLRDNSMLRDVIDGTMEGKRPRGRKPQMLDELIKSQQVDELIHSEMFESMLREVVRKKLEGNRLAGGGIYGTLDRSIDPQKFDELKTSQEKDQPIESRNLEELVNFEYFARSVYPKLLNESIGKRNYKDLKDRTQDRVVWRCFKPLVVGRKKS